MSTQSTPTIQQVATQTKNYLAVSSTKPLLFVGDSVVLLSHMPPATIDFAMTSPPYWGKREYAAKGIGLEDSYSEYIAALLRVFAQVHRVLKPTGSFWLNLGDSYLTKNLLGLPWRVAIEMTDRQGWCLRNEVIWHKVKGGPDNSTDKLRTVHEHIFHFVKQPKGYYYDDHAVRSPPKSSKVIKGTVVSATGVSGVRYQRQIELSTALTPEEKVAAILALNNVLKDMTEGKVSDFRMVIRKQQRTTHSDSSRVSGRAKELEQRGFYFLKYHPNGSKLGDVWDILPEDTQNRTTHFAPYPEDLCKIPILATCPPGGVVLDPFLGTGTTCAVAYRLGRKSIGIDMSDEYVRAANERCGV
jgi:DNA modification methylase